jgi:hypothetical protein
MLKKKEAKKGKAPTVTAATMRRALEKRLAAVEAERDLLRVLAEDCLDMSSACDDAGQAIKEAIAVLSRYV